MDEKSGYLANTSCIFAAFIPVTSLFCRTSFMPFGVPSGKVIFWTCPFHTLVTHYGLFPPGFTFIFSAFKALSGTFLWHGALSNMKTA